MIYDTVPIKFLILSDNKKIKKSCCHRVYPNQISTLIARQNTKSRDSDTSLPNCKLLGFLAEQCWGTFHGLALSDAVLLMPAAFFEYSLLCDASCSGSEPGPDSKGIDTAAVAKPCRNYYA